MDFISTRCGACHCKNRRGLRSAAARYGRDRGNPLRFLFCSVQHVATACILIGRDCLSKKYTSFKILMLASSSSATRTNILENKHHDYTTDGIHNRLDLWTPRTLITPFLDELHYLSYFTSTDHSRTSTDAVFQQNHLLVPSYISKLCDRRHTHILLHILLIMFGVLFV